MTITDVQCIELFTEMTSPPYELRMSIIRPEMTFIDPPDDNVLLQSERLKIDSYLR